MKIPSCEELMRTQSVPKEKRCMQGLTQDVHIHMQQPHEIPITTCRKPRGTPAASSFTGRRQLHSTPTTSRGVISAQQSQGHSGIYDARASTKNIRPWTTCCTRRPSPDTAHQAPRHPTQTPRTRHRAPDPSHQTPRPDGSGVRRQVSEAPGESRQQSEDWR